MLNKTVHVVPNILLIVTTHHFIFSWQKECFHFILLKQHLKDDFLDQVIICIDREVAWFYKQITADTSVIVCSSFLFQLNDESLSYIWVSFIYTY